MVKTKYTDLKFSKKWDVKDPRDEQILAMKTILRNIITSKEDDKKKKSKKRQWKGEWAKKSEEGQTTKTINGKEVKWCAKCNDGNGGWTTSHFTDGHTSKPATASQTKSENLSLR